MLCATILFISVVLLFFHFFNTAEGTDPNVSIVMSIVSGIMAGWIILSVSGTLKEFSFKGFGFEMTAIQNQINDVKTETNRIQTNVESVKDKIQLVSSQIQNIQISNSNQNQNAITIVVDSMKKLAAASNEAMDEITITPEHLKEIGGKSETSKKIDENLKKTKDVMEKRFAEQHALDSVMKTIVSDYSPNSDNEFSKARWHYLSKEFDDAIKVLTKLIKIDNENRSYFFWRGLSFSKSKEPENAISDYKKALEIDENFTPAIYNIACKYAEMNNIKASLDYLGKAIILNGDKYKKMAKSDLDFNMIKNNSSFKSLVS